MDLAFAAESLKPIPTDHILARKASDLDGLAPDGCAAPPGPDQNRAPELWRQATIDQIQQVLVPDVIRDDWKKWWEVAKRELKKDGHFQVPMKKTEPIVYQVQEVSLQDRGSWVISGPQKGLKAKLAVASEVLKNLA